MPEKISNRFIWVITLVFILTGGTIFVTGFFFPRILGMIILVGYVLGVTYLTTGKKGLQYISGMLSMGWGTVLYVLFMFPILYVFCCLFAGMMFTAWGGLLEHMGPLIAPIGFQDIIIDLPEKEFNMPGDIHMRTLVATCQGELGALTLRDIHMITSVGFVLNMGLWLLSLLGAAFNLSIRKWIPFKIRFVVTMIGIGLIIYAFHRNDEFIARLSRPLNNFLYRGHARSLVEATSQNKPELVTYIMNRGGDPYKTDKYRKKNAMEVATDKNLNEIKEIFLESGLQE